MTRLLVAAAAVVAAVVLFVLIRPNDDDEQPPTVPMPTTPTTTVPPPPPQPPPPARVRITVRGGKPVGGVREVTVGKGRRVVLTVTSDLADEVHLHGYDLMREVGRGRPARLAFRATIVGTVEAELEERGVPLARITAQP